MSEQNGLSETVSIIDLDNKIKDMQKINSSLQREINQNQLAALQLREALKAYQEKELTSQTKLKEIEATILTRRNELSSIDNLLDKERKIIEAEKRDLMALREGVGTEQSVWNAEKNASIEAIKADQGRLARQEVSLMNRSHDLDMREKDIAGQLEELSTRRIKISEMESKTQAALSEAQNSKEEAEKFLVKAKRELEEATAKSSSYDSLNESIKEKEKSFDEKNSHIKTCYNDLEVRKNELDEQERDLTIEKDKLRELRTRLSKEIEAARIDAQRKQKMKDELETK